MIRLFIANSLLALQYIITNTVYYYFKLFHSKKINFVIGVSEQCNNIKYIKEVFGEDSISVALELDPYYINNIYDYSIKPSSNRIFHFIKRIFYGPYLLAKLATQAKAFIYIWSTGFCYDRELDFKFLKKHNKKIICIFIGADIRCNRLLLEYCNEKNLDIYINYLKNTNEQDRISSKNAMLADKYANLVFSQPIDQMSILTSKQYIFRYMVEERTVNNNVAAKFENLSRIIILHAPSNPVPKGTQLVNAAIKKLQLEGYDFEYVELQGKQNDEVLQELLRSHIVLNQFYALRSGLFGIEGMATGNAVLMSSWYECEPQEGIENAWFKTGYWEVYDNIKYLLDNPEEIKGYAMRGVEYVKRSCTVHTVGQYYKSVLKENGILE